MNPGTVFLVACVSCGLLIYIAGFINGTYLYGQWNSERLRAMAVAGYTVIEGRTYRLLDITPKAEEKP